MLWGVGLVSLPAASALHLSNVGLTVFSLAAGAVAVIRGRRHTGRVRLFWRRLGAASLAWGGGMAAWTWYESLRGLEVPFPSIADVGYLALPLLAGWALLTLPLAAPTRAGRARTILDGLIVASSLLLVSWMLVLDSIVQAGGDVASQVISLAYPVSDIVLITTVVYTWMRARHRGAGLPVSLPLIGVGPAGPGRGRLRLRLPDHRRGLQLRQRGSTSAGAPDSASCCWPHCGPGRMPPTLENDEVAARPLGQPAALRRGRRRTADLVAGGPPGRDDRHRALLDPHDDHGAARRPADPDAAGEPRAHPGPGAPCRGAHRRGARQW